MPICVYNAIGELGKLSGRRAATPAITFAPSATKSVHTSVPETRTRAACLKLSCHCHYDVLSPRAQCRAGRGFPLKVEDIEAVCDALRITSCLRALEAHFGRFDPQVVQNYVANIICIVIVKAGGNFRGGGRKVLHIIVIHEAEHDVARFVVIGTRV